MIDEDDQWVDYSVRGEGTLGEEPEFGWAYLHQFKNGKCEYNHIRNVYTAVTIDDEQYRALMLNNIVLISTISEDFGLSGEMQLNEFGNSCSGNTFGNDCDYNTFGNYLRQLTVFEGVQYVSVTGGDSTSAYVQNAQILNGTHGSVSPNELQISFQPNVNYCQFAGLKSDGNLRIWTPADGA